MGRVATGREHRKYLALEMLGERMIVGITRVRERRGRIETMPGFDADDAFALAGVDLEHAAERGLPSVRPHRVGHAQVVRERGVARPGQEHDPPLGCTEERGERSGETGVGRERAVEIGPAVAQQIEHVAGEHDDCRAATLFDRTRDGATRLARHVVAARHHSQIGEDQHAPTACHRKSEHIGNTRTGRREHRRAVLVDRRLVPAGRHVPAGRVICHRHRP